MSSSRPLPNRQSSTSTSSATSYFPRPVRNWLGFSSKPSSRSSSKSRLSRNSTPPPSAMPTQTGNLIDFDYSEEEDEDDDFQPLPPPPAFESRSQSYTPSPRPTPPPFSPPPLTPLTLEGLEEEGRSNKAQIMSRLIAEEIRLLLPGRLELVDTWRLVFNLEEDGSSLTTLYDKCDYYTGRRGGFVLVVKDASGSIFGSYLSDPPAPSKGHYYGNGECFLWRSSVLSSILPSMASLPPPPSADTTHATRMTTLGLPAHLRREGPSTGTSTPERIRFKAFPYSGENDYMIFCEHGFLSVGGGDGNYGLWLDAALEQGVSSRCLTFGNEPLSEEGVKFDVNGVEVWYVGAPG